MPDVIDSLKRLERVGSEDSKTTQKLISAAGELSSLIAEHFCPGPDEEITITRGITETQPERFLNYVVRRGDFDQGESRPGNLYNNGRYVAKNREAALEFAKDISTGLLDLIVELHQQRQAESAEAVATIENVASKLRKPPMESVF